MKRKNSTSLFLLNLVLALLDVNQFLYAVGLRKSGHNLNATSTITNFYYIGTGSLSSNSNWNINSDGSGTQSTHFTTTNQYFNVQYISAVTLSANWTVSGSASKIIVGDVTAN